MQVARDYRQRTWHSAILKMAALEEVGVDFISRFLTTNTTKSLSEYLEHRFPGQKGFSTRSIERFCQENVTSLIFI